MKYSMEKDFQKALNFEVGAPLRKIRQNESLQLDNDIGIINQILENKSYKQPTVEELMKANEYYVWLLNDIHSRLLDIITFYEFFSKDDLKKNIDKIIADIRGEQSD